MQTPILFCVQCCHLASLESRSNQDPEAHVSPSCLRVTKRRGKEPGVTKRRRKEEPRETEEGAQGGQEEGEESGEKSEDEAAEVHDDSDSSASETVSFGTHCIVITNEPQSESD